MHSSPINVGVIKSRRKKWVGIVALWGREEVYTGFWYGNLGERDHLGDPDIDRIFRKWHVGAQAGSIWFRIGTGGGHL